MDGSSATTAPSTLSPSARRPSNAASCAAGSTVSETDPPLGWLLPIMSTTRSTKSRGSLPDRMSFWVGSSGVAAVDVGVVAGQVGVLERLLVAPLVLVLVVDRHALGDRLPADEDRAALAGELRVAHPLVVVAGVEVVGLDVLQVGRRSAAAPRRAPCRRSTSRGSACSSKVHHLGGVVAVVAGVVGREVRERAAGLVGDAQQQRDDRPVGDQRRAAVGQERAW